MNRNILNQTKLSNENINASNANIQIGNIEELNTDNIDINNLNTENITSNTGNINNLETKEIETDEIKLKNNRLKSSSNNNITFIDTTSTIINNNSTQTISGLKTFNNLRLGGDTIVYNNGNNNLFIGNIVDISSSQTITGIKTFHNLRLNGDTLVYNNGSNSLTLGNIVDLSSNQTLTGIKTFNNNLRCDTLLTCDNFGIGCLNPVNNEILKRNLILDENSSVSDYQLNLTSDGSNGRCAGIAFTITGGGSINGMTSVYPNHTPGSSIIFERTGSWSIGILGFNIKNSATQTGSLTNVMNLYNNKVEILTDLICDNITCENLTLNKPLILTNLTTIDLTTDNLTINNPLNLSQELNAIDIITTNLTSINGNINDLIIVNGFANTFTITNLTSTNLRCNNLTINNPLILTEDLICNNLNTDLLNVNNITSTILNTDLLIVNSGAVIEEAHIKNININNSIISTNNTDLSLRRNNVEKIRLEEDYIIISEMISSNSTILTSGTIAGNDLTAVNLNCAFITSTSIKSNLYDSLDNSNVSIRRNNEEKIRIQNNITYILDRLNVGNSGSTTLNFVVNDSINNNGQFFIDLKNTTYNRLRSTQPNISNSKDLMITAGTSPTSPNIYIKSENNRIGINNSNPLYSLHVNGDIRSNNLINNIIYGGDQDNTNLYLRGSTSGNNLGKIIIDQNSVDIARNLSVVMDIFTTNLFLSGDFITLTGGNLSIRRNSEEFIKLVKLTDDTTITEIISDNTFIDNLFVNKINTDEITTDKITTDEITTDKITTDEIIFGNSISNNNYVYSSESGTKNLIIGNSNKFIFQHGTYSSGNLSRFNSATDDYYLYYSQAENFGFWSVTNGLVWRFNNGGNLNCVSLTETSDIRIKKNIELIDCCDSLDKIKNINVYKYNYINQKDGDKKRIGIIADQVEEYVPEIIEISNTEEEELKGT